MRAIAGTAARSRGSPVRCPPTASRGGAAVQPHALGSVADALPSPRRRVEPLRDAGTGSRRARRLHRRTCARAVVGAMPQPLPLLSPDPDGPLLPHPTHQAAHCPLAESPFMGFEVRVLTERSESRCRGRLSATAPQQPSPRTSAAARRRVRTSDGRSGSG